MTKTKFQSDLLDYILSGHVLININTHEKDRSIEEIVKLSKSDELQYDTFVWTISSGWCDSNGVPIAGGADSLIKPEDAFTHILQWGNPSLFILKDYGVYLNNMTYPSFDIPISWIDCTRKEILGQDKTIIFVGPDFNVPTQLKYDIVSMDFSLPDEQVINRLIECVCEKVETSDNKKFELDKKWLPDLVQASKGMTQQQILDRSSLALRKTKHLKEDATRLIMYEKGQAIRDSGILSYEEPPKTGFSSVGGYGAIKEHVLLDKQCICEQAKEFGIEHPKGLLLVGIPGCHAKATKILMYDGSLKNVEDIEVGDKLMGPDSSPRQVLKLVRGTENMVKIIPTKGEPFVVNENHILSLMPSRTKNPIKHILNVSVKDYLKQSKCYQGSYKLYRTGVDFKNKNKLLIDPYILGVWLGDGDSDGPSITTTDNEIKNSLINYAKKNNMSYSIGIPKRSKKIMRIRLKSKDGKFNNIFLNNLRKLNLLDNKHIPQEYLTASRKDRLNLLAGIIDTDGYKHVIKGTKRKYGVDYDLISKYKHLSEQILFLARSLGFASYIKQCTKGCWIGKNKYFEGTYWRVSIIGDTCLIPVRLQYKKCNKRKQIKDVLRTGFSVEKLPKDKYYGFVVDKDHLYVMGDFTVTHNCGKTLIARTIASEFNQPLIIFEVGNIMDKYVGESESKMSNAIKLIESIAPCVLMLDEVEKGFGGDGMDGGASKRVFGQFLKWLSDKQSSVYVVATANNIASLPPEFGRKGRFDEIFGLDLPDNNEKREILEIHIEKCRHDLSHSEITQILKNMNRFTGADIEQTVKLAMKLAFVETNKIVNVDIMNKAIKSIKPLAEIEPERIEIIRQWIGSRAKSASLESLRNNNESTTRKISIG